VLAEQNIDSWQKTSNLPYKIASQSSIGIFDTIFVIGGSASTGYTEDSVIRASVDFSGNVLEWVNNSITPTKLIWHSSPRLNRHIFILGGFLDNISPGGSVNTAYVASVHNPPTSLIWMQTNSLPKRLAQGGSATYGKWIYFVGGFTDYQNNASSDVYFSEVNIDGSLGTWASTTSLPQPGYGMDLIENNGYLYVIGLNDSQVVLYSKINDDGTLGNWIETSPLPQIATRGSVVKAGSSVYLIGGNPGPTGNIYVASFNPDGTLSDWQQNPTGFPRSQCCSPGVEVGGRIYVLGGHDGNAYYDSVWVSNKLFEPTPYPTWTPEGPTPTATPKPTPSPTQVKKIVFIPGMGASWNADALLNCKSSGYSGSWSMAPYAKDVYKNVLDKLNDEYEVLEFYYDWRNDVRVSADNLKSFIQKKTEPSEKVNIFGHSMGGLVGRSYVEIESNKVDKYFSAGSPHLGTTIAYPAWSGGELWDGDLLMNMGKIIALKRCDVMENDKEIIREYFPSFQNLLPVFDYIRDKKTNKLTSYSTMSSKNNWLPRSFGGNSFSTKIGTLSGTGKKTIKEIVVKEAAKKDSELGVWADGKPVSRKLVIEGDGAVLVSSAILPDASNLTLGVTHNGMLSNKQGLEWILNFFTEKPVSLSNVSEYKDPRSAIVVIGEGEIEYKTSADIQKADSLLVLTDVETRSVEVSFKPKRASGILSIGQFNNDRLVSWEDYKLSGMGVRNKRIQVFK
jgi:pimeloyl-ACP methyl ester carboxylesterase